MLALAILTPLLASLVAAQQPSAQNATLGLNALARNHGKYIGTATNSLNLAGNQPGGKYLEILRREFVGAFTAENEGKWDHMQPSPGQYNYAGMDVIVNEARQQRAFMRGHTIVWHAQTPDYINTMTDAEQLKTALREHAFNVTQRYHNDWTYLDAVNEPLEEDGSLRDSVWKRVLGDDYLAIVLGIIHEQAPSIKLCINDYNIEGVNAKSQALAVIAKNLLERGVPLHCIGFESHFIAESVPQDLDQSMRANDYRNVTQACFHNTLCPGITVWQFYDPISWIPGVTPGWGAATLFDADFNPKPAFKAMQEVLQAPRSA